MIRVRIGAREFRFPETEWEAHVSEGRVPPDALVFSLQLTGGLWRRADPLPLFDFFRARARRSGARRAGRAPSPPFDELPGVVFPRRGVSAPRSSSASTCSSRAARPPLARRLHRPRLRAGAALLRSLGRAPRSRSASLATLFMHADFGAHQREHDLAACPRRPSSSTSTGAASCSSICWAGWRARSSSFAWKGHGPMSVGASGAIFALYRRLRRLRAAPPRAAAALASLAGEADLPAAPGARDAPVDPARRLARAHRRVRRPGCSSGCCCRCTARATVPAAAPNAEGMLRGEGRCSTIESPSSTSAASTPT